MSKQHRDEYEFSGGLYLPRCRVLRPRAFNHATPGVIAGGGSGGGGGGTVLVDVAAFSNTGNNGVTSENWAASGQPGVISLNVGSGPNGTTNRALVVVAICQGAAAGTSTGMTMTWDSVSMTLLGSSLANVGDMFLFGLRNPNLGAKVLTASWTGANQVWIAALSCVGVNQSSDAAAFKNFTSGHGSGSPNSLAITNASGAIAMAGHVSSGNFSTAGNTDIGHNNTGNLNAVAGNYSTTANPTMTYAFTGGSAWASLGCSISA